jgi:tetratricopeptide (TPR) repeat protein
MASANELVERAKEAHKQRLTGEALVLYAQAAEASRREGELMRWAHSLRHAAELALQMGEVDDARRDIGAVVSFYKVRDVADLEMANALRVAGLAGQAAGDFEGATASWKQALGLYERVGVAEGVAEAYRRIRSMAEAKAGLD